MRDTVAISVACGLVIAITGSISVMITGSQIPHMPHHSTGYIYWPAFLCVGLMSPIFAQLGASLSHRLPVPRLKRIFGIMMLLVAVRLLVF